MANIRKWKIFRNKTSSFPENGNLSSDISIDNCSNCHEQKIFKLSQILSKTSDLIFYMKGLLSCRFEFHKFCLYECVFQVTFRISFGKSFDLLFITKYEFDETLLKKVFQFENISKYIIVGLSINSK